MIERKGVYLNLIFGMVIGIIVGVFAGVNISTWNYSEVIVQGYIEVISDDNGTLFASRGGQLYQLIKINKAKDLEKKVDDVINALKQHDSDIRIKKNILEDVIDKHPKVTN